MLGIYIHIPFCIKKCDYCDYNSYPDRLELVEDYLKALKSEIKKASHMYDQEKVGSIYLGGGTPSLLSEKQIIYLCAHLKNCFKLNPDIEFNIESNPRDISFQKLSSFHAAGINRISLGVQSFSNEVLSILGRMQKEEESVKALEAINNYGFKNFNIDLIYGIPVQSLNGWRVDLEKAFNFHPKHISIYPLTIPDDSPFANRIKKGMVEEIDEDEQSDYYLLAIEFLTRNGFRQYEISNFSNPGYECQHNLTYWLQGNYLGFGAGAHSHIDGLRWSNVKKIKQYITLLNQGRSIILSKENLTHQEKLSEYIFLKLRLNDGFKEKEINERFNINFRKKYKKVLRKLAALELLEDKDSIKLTDKGRFLANEVFRSFI